jgi:hypothetical protein
MPGALGAGAALFVEVLRADALVVAATPTPCSFPGHLGTQAALAERLRPEEGTDAGHHRQQGEADEEGEDGFG